MKRIIFQTENPEVLKAFLEDMQELKGEIEEHGSDLGTYEEKGDDIIITINSIED